MCFIRRNCNIVQDYITDLVLLTKYWNGCFLPGCETLTEVQSPVFLPSYPTDRLFSHRQTVECASQPQAFSRRHFKPSEQMRSPDGAKIKYNRWLHNRNHFLENRLREDVLFYSDKNVSSNSARSVFKQRSELSPKKAEN